MTSLSAFRLPPALFNAALITRIHAVWFAEQPPSVAAPTQASQDLWFGKNRTPEQRRAFDSDLRAAFGPALAALAPNQLPLPPFTTYAADRAAALTLSAPLRALDVLKSPDEQERARGGLGLVLLLDQVPRNIFRSVEEQAVVFTHYDRLARALVYAMMLPGLSGAGGRDDLADVYGMTASPWLAPSPARRNWFYLPLMHSEDLVDHDAWTEVMKRFLAEVEAGGDEEAAEYLRGQFGFEEQHRGILERFGRYPHRNECQGRDTTAEEREYLEGGGETFTR